ncbi:hypothetical protein UF75_3067 [Desulfosporosinus sp. I2]|nr:hypothetical protein UF75_3067 [Desulfosporosinus sp. I2]
MIFAPFLLKIGKNLGQIVQLDGLPQISITLNFSTKYGVVNKKI